MWPFSLCYGHMLSQWPQQKPAMPRDFLEPLGEVKGTVTQWWLWMYNSSHTACIMDISAGTLCACTARRNHPLPAAAAAAARRWNNGACRHFYDDLQAVGGTSTRQLNDRQGWCLCNRHKSFQGSTLSSLYLAFTWYDLNWLLSVFPVTIKALYVLLLLFILRRLLLGFYSIYFLFLLICIWISPPIHSTPLSTIPCLGKPLF